MNKRESLKLDGFDFTKIDIKTKKSDNLEINKSEKTPFYSKIFILSLDVTMTISMFILIGYFIHKVELKKIQHKVELEKIQHKVELEKYNIN